MPSLFSGVFAHYDLTLLAVSLIMSATASWSVFWLRSRMKGARGLVSASWTFLCGLGLGAGLWAAQFLADAAFDPQCLAGFSLIDVLVALLITVIGFTAAFAVAWSGRGFMRTVAGGLLLAFSMAGAQYMSLRSFHMQAHIAWQPIFVWFGVVAGSVLTIASLVVAGRARGARARAGGTLFMVAAVTALHVLGLSAMTVTPDASVSLTPDMVQPKVMALTVVILSTMIILGKIGSAYIYDISSRDALGRIRRLADATREGIVVLTREGTINDCNAAFAAMAGASIADLMGEDLLRRWLKLDVATLTHDHTFIGALVSAEGEPIPVEVICRPLVAANDEASPPTVVVIRDLREERAVEDRMRYLAEHDQLTGLPNRHALLAYLQDAVAKAIDRVGSPLMLAAITVTNSKEINELFGNAAGDAMLRKIAERLARFTVEGTFSARCGGADFAYVGYGDDRSMDANIEHGAIVSTALHGKLCRPFDYDGRMIEPKVAIGLSAAPYDASTVSEIMIHAEAATLRARAQNVPMAMFSVEAHQRQRERRQLARDLRTAITDHQLDDQFVVYYQPQARAEDSRITGFEALVRWRHPEHGMTPPDQFIAIAEENGLIADLGEWVLQRACRDAASWDNPLSVAVNLSPLQVGHALLPTRIHEILLETGLSPSRLELEVTESALFDNEQRALDVLRRLKGLGLRVAMDDFGTGYSSLSSLHSFPFDKIKIDKSFVQGIGKLERSTVLVRVVLGLGRGLNIPVVAEGVETAEQFAFLKAEGCAVIQGYLLGRPAPIEAYAELVNDRPAKRAAAG